MLHTFFRLSIFSLYIFATSACVVGANQPTNGVGDGPQTDSTDIILQGQLQNALGHQPHIHIIAENWNTREELNSDGSFSISVPNAAFEGIFIGIEKGGRFQGFLTDNNDNFIKSKKLGYTIE